MAYTDYTAGPINPLETEEERKKREEAMSNEVAHTNETTTYRDGSQTHVTTQEVPATIVQETALEPQPVAQPVMQQPAVQQQAMQPAPQPAVQQPVVQPAAQMVPRPAPQQMAQQPAPQPAEQPAVQAPPSMYSLSNGQPSQGLRIPAPPVNQPLPSGEQSSDRLIQHYQNIQDSAKDLMQLGFADSALVPDWLKSRAKSRAADIISSDRAKQKAQDDLKNMGPSELAKALREKTSGGSWLKAIAFGLLGMETSAQAEAAKLGLGKEIYSQINNQPAMIKMSSNGTPISGYNATTGKQLTPEELVTAVQYGQVQKGAQTHTGKMQDTNTGEVYYERTTPQGIELVDTNGKKFTGLSSNLRPFGIGSDIRTKNEIQINELQNKLAFAGPTASVAEREKIIGESEARFGPLPESFKQQVRSGGPAVSGTVPTTPTPPATAAPAPQPSQQVPMQAPVSRPQGPVTPTPLQAPAVQPVAQPQMQQPVRPVAPSSISAPAGQTPAAREAAQKLQIAGGEAAIQQRKELETAKLKPPQEALGKNEAKSVNNQNFADQSYSLIAPIASLIKESTGSGIGTRVDQLASQFGVGTKGQQAIARLQPMIYPILANVPRFEGPQSDYDVQVYKQAAGDFGNSKLPVETRLAALQGIVTLMKKYDRAGTNDWSFGERAQAGTASNPIRLQ